MDKCEQMIDSMSQVARVVVSSEIDLPESLKSLCVSIPLERMHDLIYYADLLIGPSATMCSEAACLGTPAILIDQQGRGYIDHQRSVYGLCDWFKPTELQAALQKARDILSDTETPENIAIALRRLNEDLIDVSSYQIEQIRRFACARG
jgi:predicted glycosyltransferase